MADPNDSQFLDDPEFQSLLVGCLEAFERGETIDREALANDFPKFAEEIGQFLDSREILRQLAVELWSVAEMRCVMTTAGARRLRADALTRAALQVQRSPQYDLEHGVQSQRQAARHRRRLFEQKRRGENLGR